MKIEYLNSVVLLSIPILGFYKFSGLSLDVILMLVCLVISLLSKKYNIEIKLFFVFLGFAIINLFSYSQSLNANRDFFLNNTIFFLAYSFLFCSLINNASIKIFLKWGNVIALLSSIVVVVQFFFYNFFNISLEFFLPFELVTGLEDYSVSIEVGRPNSFFLEPAHFAIYVLPFFYFNLTNKKYFNAIFIIFSVLLSTSTTGFSLAIFLLIIYFLKHDISFRNIIVLIFMFFAVGMVFLQFQDIFEMNMNKLSDESMKENIRLFGGIEFFDKIIDRNLFFGIGLNQMQTEFKALNYTNTYFMTFISFGTLGVVLLLIMVGYLYRKNKNIVYLILLIIIMGTDQLLFNRNFLYLISVVYMFNEANKINEFTIV